MALIDLPQKFSQIKVATEQVKFSDVRLSEEFKSVYQKYVSDNPANGYSEVEWADCSAKIITSTGKVIYLTNYWFYIASELASYLDGLNEQKEIFKSIFTNEDLQQAAISLRSGMSADQELKIKNYFSDNALTDNDYDCFYKFVSDYKSWGGGKTIDRNDYYVSPLLQAGNLLAETQSAVAEIAKQFSQDESLRDAFEPLFISSSASGVASSSEVLSEDSRGQFVYDLIDYLLTKNIEDRLFTCLIEKSSEHGSYNLENKEYRLTSFFKVSETLLDDDDLVRGDKVRFFSKPFNYLSKYYYLSNQWTDGTESRLDIQTLIPLFNSLYSEYQISSDNGRYILRYIPLIKGVSIPKPFILLAGISGTGKTRFVREQAAAHNVGDNNFCLVPVRPDWHEPSDLLGYISRIGGKPEYVSTKVLQFVIDAWKSIAPHANSGGVGEFDLESVPYWLCLDEMNLAPVEQYFSDYLSVLESRKFSDGVYTCDPLLDKSVLETEGANIQKDLKLNAHQDLWDFFCINGISLPPNVIVAGTVNMDETTHGFSRKVIDRALSIDFGEFFPNDYGKFFKGQDVPKTLTYSTETHVNEDTFGCVADSDGSQTVAFLEDINSVLRDTPFELAYRALNELLLYVNSFGPDSNEKLQAVWDDFLMTKVLPRIDGDDDKLRIIVDGKSFKLLEKLETVLSKQLELIWNEDKKRVDLLRDDENGAEISDISCRSRKKIKWMRNRLEINTFTSYWP